MPRVGTEARQAAARALEISLEHGIACFNLGAAWLLEEMPRPRWPSSRSRAGRGARRVSHWRSTISADPASFVPMKSIRGYALTNAYQVAEVHARARNRCGSTGWSAPTLSTTAPWSR